MVTLEKDEQVIERIQKHWFLFAVQCAVYGFLAISPLLILPYFPWESSFPGNHLYLGTFLWSVWLFILWIGLFISWTNYYLDVLIITTKRLIYVNQIGPFSRRISISRLDRIQDATGEIFGIIPTLLDFGSVTIQTAAEEQAFVIHDIPNPSHVKSKILLAQEEAKKTEIPELS